MFLLLDQVHFHEVSLAELMLLVQCPVDLGIDCCYLKLDYELDGEFLDWVLFRIHWYW